MHHILVVFDHFTVKFCFKAPSKKINLIFFFFFSFFGGWPNYFFLPGIVFDVSIIFFSSAFDFSCVSFSSALKIKVKCRLEFRKNYYEKIHKPKFDSKSSKRIKVKREVGFIRKEFLVSTNFLISNIFKILACNLIFRPSN